MKPEEIIKRFNTLHSQRKVVEEEWEIISTFVAPRKGKFFREATSEAGIEWTNRQVFDGTAIQAAKLLASRIHGSLTNPLTMWFDLRWRDEETRTENQEAQEWLEAAGQRVYHEIQDSNFNLNINHTYGSVVSYGTGFITAEPKAEPQAPWAGIDFTSVPLRQSYFEADEKGGCLNFYRHMRWPASKIVSKFGIANVSEKVKASFAAASDAEHSVIFCAYTRLDKQNQKEAILTPENRPFGWCYIGRDDKHKYGEGGYYEMPAYAARWDTVEESVWGQSPAMDAMADILTLNQIVELQLAALAKVVDPPILAGQRALLADLDMGPGVVNVVRDPDKVREFLSGGRFDISQMKIEDMRRQVRSYFFMDQLELKDSPAMTATEVQVRYEMMQSLMSSTLSQLKEDMLDPLIQRVFNMLYRAGELGDAPIDVGEFDIEYTGPMSRAQRFDQSASIERWITQLQLIAQAGPAAEVVLLVPDYDAIARDAAVQLNLPTKYTKTSDEVKADIQKQSDQQARQAGAEAAQAEASAVKDLKQAGELAGGEQNIAGPPAAA